MSKEMYVSSSPHETKVAVLEDDQLVEVYFERDTDVGLVGGIYKGRVSRVLPGMQSAFVDIGLERDAFLYVSDFFYEDQEEFEKVFEEAEARATKLTSRPVEAAAAPAPSVATEPSAPVLGQAAEPPVTPLEAHAPAVSAATPATPPSPVAGPPMAAKDYTDRRPYDPRRDDRNRGRRRRHRGRPEFGARRHFEEHGDRRFPPSHHAEEPTTEYRPLEILPGESLAKYSHAGYEKLSAPLAEPGEGGSVRPETTVSGNLSGEDDDFASVNSPVVQAYEMSESTAPGRAEVPEAEPLPPAEAQAPAAAVTAVVTDAMAPLSPAATEASAVRSDAESLASDNAKVSFAASGASLPARAEEPVPVAPSFSSPIEPVAESQREPEIAAASSSPSFAAEVAASYSVEEIAGPSSGEPEPNAAVAAGSETPTESATVTAAPGAVEAQPAAERGEFGEDEVEDEEDEVSDEDEELLEVAQTEGLPEGAEAEPSAEGEPGTESELAEEVAAAAGAEGQPSVQEGGSSDSAAAGEPGDRSYTLREPHQRPRFNPRRRRGRRNEPGGRRFDRPRESSRPGNHAPVQIAEVLKEGQEILVQIAKEPLGTKGARITSHVALPGRYLVYMPTTEHIGVSRKIASEEERLRLRNIIQENKGSLTGGFIVRTAGQGRPEEEFKADLKFLGTLWAEIRAKADRLRAPALLHRDLDLVQRLLRDLLTPDFKSVRVDNEIDYERVLEFVNRCQPALVGKVKLYTRDTPLYEEFGIQQEIEKALKPKVWLKSGGYIVINQTEALVAIDVNTGKYVGKTNRLEDTIVRTNVDAVNEIVRQVRLRDLGGIIVIDFIDMDERKNRAKVVQALEEALRSDRAPTKVISFNDFGLVAVTRKRVKQSLERALCQPCDYCTGSGWVKSVNTVCNEILAEARKMAKQIDGNVITLRVNPEVAKALKSREGGLLNELESLTKKDVIIKGDSNVHQERFEIF